MWQQILDMLPVGIIVYDNNNAIAHINNLAREILDYDRSLPGVLVNTIEVAKITVNDKIYVTRRVNLDGGLAKSAILLIDITDWHFYWDELKEQRELIKELEDTFNSSFDEIYVIDGDGVTKRINQAGETNYGVPVEQLLGKNVRDLEREGFYNPSVSKLVLQERKRLTITQKTIQGKHLIATGNPTFDEKGDIVRIVVNSRDISELFNLKKQLEVTEQLVENYRRQLLKLSEEKINNFELIAQSQQMKRVLEIVDNVAKVDSTVLIMGESGVGKGVMASRLHKLSKRAGGAYLTISCGAIPEQLLESELFGYEGGAFTGARKEGKKGLLELASGGTVFLDEITELSLNLQVKLLQAIQEKKLMRVGGSKYIDIDVRFVAATNRDIQRMVEEGQFREDLYYRLNVIPIIIPPLRYRQEDIPVLINYFLEKLNCKYEKDKIISSEAVEVLCNYNWPGNVRELENLVERLLVTKECSEITVGHLPDYIFDGKSRFPNRVYVVDVCPLKEAVEELEKQLVTIAYKRYKNTYKIAEALEINQSTAVRKIQKYQLSPTSEQRQAFRKARQRKN
ncbi:sigma-54 interaction domain-containing protein [Pelotomaculum propionicicum]|uniref:sigma-54 interaction domain-containing protein n=1 Tax=Pelotomaculum propionicicum TaxID=258475 RepID=UPI003B787598